MSHDNARRRQSLADVEQRVGVLGSKVDHPSAQRLTVEQHERLRAEVRTVQWVARERRHRVEWATVLARVEALVERVDRMVPVVEVDVPAQARGAGPRVARPREADDVPVSWRWREE
ncbi:hypothetical protein [Saccharothrix yanglingensis]|uniref:hypothetical protein n=1 Tax=Saccharothrix yanglingensis TaxID=659496 RepID=UPI0027D26D48|nr:hypothetical protein [Saccharothrix yanglingensis]